MLSAEPVDTIQQQQHHNIATDSLIEDVNLTVIQHPYLDELADKIRTEPIPWQDYQRAGLITADEVAMIEHVENKTPEEVNTIMAEHGLYYAGMYLDLMHKLARVDAVQKVLVLIQDMLNDHDERIALFHQAAASRPEYPFGPFHKALQINDEFIGIQSSKILALLVCSTDNRDIDINDFFRWMTFQLQSRNANLIELNIQILDALFHIPPYRMAFWNTLHAVDTLVNILKKGSSNPQVTYEIVFAIWLLTFDRDIAANLNKKYDVIPTLIEVAKQAVKEKIIRVVVATFKNLIDKAPRSNLSAMLVAKLLPFVEHLSTRKWYDQEVVDDIEFVQERLQDNFQSLTTFEVYASELETGKLEWSPPHQSENFWRQNASRLNEDDRRLLRMLVRLLSTSTQPTILAITCHDIGQYVKHSGNDGRRYLQELGAKQKVMELMTHQDPDVRYHALSATQKYFAMVASSSQQ
ncbi:atpase v1 complex subunit h [Lichtheimia corymbifera JMRC:FSU:9682]|uniref:V-type proton ATPase subunit H n=1 Tax=Lichtheimia corymbifera JMRC:FSU:9682 TaxID=1263082 RepID=A0A068RY29_9FUNG|nr:atpase v1 complex subunit h [Lichtheimia corymbifera JMRC:FSU:9682]